MQGNDVSAVHHNPEASVVETTLTRVGNSIGVLLPKALREKALLDDRAKVRLTSPRKGIVIVSSIDDDADRLERFQEAEAFFNEISADLPPWHDGETAEDLLNKARGERNAEFLSI